MKRWAVGLVVVVVVLVGVGASFCCAAVEIDLVTVGNTGNAADTTGYGKPAS